MINKRASGVLMHISSLPGDTGIGTLGQAAYKFVDFLHKAGQSYWQILPICPTGFGDSPYQSVSTFAGNPYFIDLDMLVDSGYIKKSEWQSVDWGDNETKVDYSLLYQRRHELFLTVQKAFFNNLPDDYNDFCNENAFWLDDYALFMAVKDEHGSRAYNEWEDGIRTRESGAVCAWRDKCRIRIEYYKMLQYLFYKQWFALKKYANERGVQIIGDLPIYVSGDSADVWASPEQFALNEEYQPIEVAGCPPDAFSADGQLWGNPVYDWDYMRNTGYSWWIKRIEFSLKIYDIIRIDHFRGFDSYYCIKYGSKSAKDGVWRQGPGMDLWNRVRTVLGELPVIAEDLGFLTDSVRQLLKDSGFPGMKILQFAFDPSGYSVYLPYKYERNCVVYTGTHDNDTIIGWAKNHNPYEVDYAKRYLHAKTNKHLCENMMLSALQCTANTCILTMQDLLYLDSKARMNEPSTVGNNWQWRMSEEQLTDDIAEWLCENTRLYGR